MSPSVAQQEQKAGAEIVDDWTYHHMIFSNPGTFEDATSIRVGEVNLTGLPEDWSHRYVVFSDPGTEQEAIQSGHYEQWQRIVNEPRYVIQQLNRHARAEGPAAPDVEYGLRWIAEATGSEEAETPEDLGAHPPAPVRTRIRRQFAQPNLKRDWSQALGGPGLAANQYPAKYSFSTTSASCGDYVIFPTGAAGSGSQATIVAFNNIYVGTGGCEASNPTVYWAYNTGTAAIANLSPVLSLDGTQVAFIEVSSSNQAALVILRMAPPSSGGGTVTAPVAPMPFTTATYNGCTAPCFTVLFLAGTPNDTNSAPFYVYDGSDTLYVGDNKGVLHQFTGVFNGTPTETSTNGWPVTVSSGNALTSPVYDTGGSTLVFVGDAGGFLDSITTTGTTRTVFTSNHLVCGTAGFVDAPVIDPTTEFAYVSSGDGCDTPPGNSYVNRFATGTSISASYGANYVSMGNVSTTNTSTIMSAGSFDNLYYAGSGNTGNFYVCVNGTLFQIPMATFITSGGASPSTANSFSTPVSSVSNTATCSPVTEFTGAKAATTLTASLGTTGNPAVASTTGMSLNDYLQIDSEIMQITAVTPTLTVNRGQLGTTAAAHAANAPVTDIQDWAFISVQGNGNAASCTGACVYNFSITTGATTGSPTAGLAAAGGTSGIIIDNQSTTQAGAQQVYFSTLAGDTAVQASQSALQ